MFLIREAKPVDLEPLLKLAKTVHFTNLPASREGVSERIQWSQKCFREKTPALGLGRADASWNGLRGVVPRGVGGAGGISPHYMFVIEDTTMGQAVGTSAIIAEMGNPGNPNVALQLRRREMFSKDLHGGQAHTTAQIVFDENGPTELGGLIIGGSFRGARLGRQIAYVRFHFIGLHRERFKDRLLAEMMGVAPDGHSPFWDAFGRRFINLSFIEADLFCQKSREFMLSLLPREEIYLTLLPPEARAVLGKVGPETAPARKMLESLGFKNHDRIDPFDGGPHLEAQTEQVGIIRDTRWSEIGGAIVAGKGRQMGFVSVDGAVNPEEPFRCVLTEYSESRDGSTVLLPADTLAALGADGGASIGLTPMPERPRAAEHPKEKTAGSGRRRGVVSAGARKVRKRAAK